MPIEEIRNIKSDRREWRKFGIVMFVAFGLIGGWLLWKQREWYLWMFAASGFFLACALALPVVLRPLYFIWMAFAAVAGWFMTRVILAILFYLIITPIGLVMRLTGRDPLDRKFPGKEKSYWVKCEPSQNGSKDAENQF